MTEQTAELQKGEGRSCWHRLARFIGILGRCFILALVYTLVAFPLSVYFGGPATLASKPLFVSNLFFCSFEAILAIRIFTILSVLAYFVLMGRYGLPLYVKALGLSPSLLSLFIVILFFFLLFISIPEIVITSLLGFHGGEFSKALLAYTQITVWPFTIAVLIAGGISGLTMPFPGPVEEPPELRDFFGGLGEKARELTGLLGRIAGIIDPALQGNVVGATLAGLSVTALATAGVSDDPLVVVLLFAVPLINALGDYPAFVLFRELRREIFETAPSTCKASIDFIIFSVPVSLVLIFVKGFVLFVGTLVVNFLSPETAVPWRTYVQAATTGSFGQGIVVTVMLLSPALWAGFHIVQPFRRGRANT